MKKNSNVFAIVGLILSATISAILGIIFSIVGINEAKKNNGYLKGIAIAGLVVGIVRIISYILLIIATLVFIKTPDIDDICKKSYNCSPGLFGNYECEYLGDNDIEQYSTCSKEQVEKFNIAKTDYNHKKVNIVVFYGSGCPHCEHLFEYLDELGQDPTYSKMFTVTKYDTWTSNDSLELMYKAQDYFDLEHSRGVPFYIIGDEYYVGFGNPANMTYQEKEEFKQHIKDAYFNGYTDITTYLNK